MSEITDIYQRVTDHIVAALEAGVKAGDWSAPWNSGSLISMPVNAESGKPYRGVNVIALWATAHVCNYDTGVWATYKQWQELGAQVRKGEKATAIVFWKQFSKTVQTDAGEEDRTAMMARAYYVFNAAQVDGYAGRGDAPISATERDTAADAYFAAIGATVVQGRPCYVPSQDIVMMPPIASFNEAPAYYAVLAHELTHWTGAKHRLDRDLSTRFGSESYAMEELVAELGAAFTCAALGISREPRKDHAAYIASWLRVLKGDKRAIFTAAAAAQKATDYLAECASAAQPMATAA